MTTKTIGSGGDYPDLATWWANRPLSGDLVTAAQIWRGEILNPAELFNSSGGTPVLTISGGTTSASFYFELTTNAANHASFRDNAGVQSNALRYNASNGCAITTTTISANAIVVNQDYTRISNLQISALGTALTVGVSAGNNCDVNNCILEGSGSGSSASGAFQIYGAGNKVRNSLIVQRASGASFIAWVKNGSEADNCTFVVPNDLTAATDGIVGAYAGTTLKNCYVGHATNFSSGTAPTLTTCASDLTAATGRIQVPYSTATFANITDSTRDFRLVTGSGLIDVGTTDSTNAATDIAGTSRPSGASYDIGAWEFVSGGGATDTLMGQACL